ncbi:MAG: RluA family pseudouridine synthase [Thermodesulfovibrionia bacterium]|nr:RluA family pseudouridine synthase [Thermodesulfovibrionia bacterium]
MKKTTYIVSHEVKIERLDTFIPLKSGLSRSHVQKLIKQGLVIVNSRIEKVSYKVKNGDRIELTIPDEPESPLVPEDIPLDVIYEDEHIIIINKPPKMIVHPAAGHKSGTLINALIYRCGKLASIGAPLRPGIVHRLDKDTSGIIVIAKDDAAYLNLCKQFEERKVEKHYLALLYGTLKKDKEEINTPIGRAIADRKKMSTKTRKGKEAVTQFEVIKRFKSATMVKIKIITGRTHQIRVHFAASGHSVLGDKIYGKKTNIKFAQKTINFSRQMLHAQSLKFKHPIDGRPLEFTTPIPKDIETAIKELNEEST